jgi:hypothetical protein
MMLVLALAPCAAVAEWPQIALEERFAGFDRPVQLAHAGDGSGRLFVADVGQNSYEEVNVQPAR